jgi:hypothetical protein
LTKDQQRAEPGQIASEYSGTIDAAAGAAGDRPKEKKGISDLMSLFSP